MSSNLPSRRDLYADAAWALLAGLACLALAAFILLSGDGTGDVKESRWIRGELQRLEQANRGTSRLREVVCYAVVRGGGENEIRYEFKKVFWNKMSAIKTHTPIELRVVEKVIINGPDCLSIIEARVDNQVIIPIEFSRSVKTYNFGFALALATFVAMLAARCLVGAFNALRLLRRKPRE